MGKTIINYECEPAQIAYATAPAITFTCSVVGESVYAYLLYKMSKIEVSPITKLQVVLMMVANACFPFWILALKWHYVWGCDMEATQGSYLKDYMFATYMVALFQAFVWICYPMVLWIFGFGYYELSIQI